MHEFTSQIIKMRHHLLSKKFKEKIFIFIFLIPNIDTIYGAFMSAKEYVKTYPLERINSKVVALLTMRYCRLFAGALTYESYLGASLSVTS